MYPTQLHSYLLRRSLAEPTPANLASKRYTAAVSLIPAMMCGIFVYGWYAGLVVLTCLASAWLTDWVCLRFIYRREAAQFGKRDGVWLLTGLLIGLMLPPAMPLYLAALGTVVAMLAGKYLLQVDGTPLLQPALLGLLALHILCPLFLALSSGSSNATMNPHDHWPVLSRGTSLESPEKGTFLPEFMRNFFGGDIRHSMDRQQYREDLFSNKPITAEAVHGPRPQDLVAAMPGRDFSSRAGKKSPPDSAAAEMDKLESGGTDDWLKLLLGYLPGTIGASSGLALLLGVMLMLFSRSVSPLIPFFAILTMLVGLLLVGWLGGQGAEARVMYGNIPIHLLSGGTLLAIFYFASDPAVTARTKKGMIYAGIFFGLFELIFRMLFKCSDCLVLSILLTQAMSFVIDQWLAPLEEKNPSAVHVGLTQSSLHRL